MLSFNTRAIVLKSTIYKDTDKIYTFLSKEKGRISGVAKGVRKISSRRGGNLDTLNVVDLKLNPHVSGLNYISEVKGIKAFGNLKKNYDLMKKAFYIVELVLRMTKEDSNVAPIYTLLEETLSKFETSEEDIRVTVNKFEIKLLQLLGYQPTSKLLLQWRDYLREREYAQADSLIKTFVFEIVGEEIKSLELM